MTKPLPDFEDLPLDRDAKILDHHPSGLIAIDKPVGVLTHPNRKDEKKEEQQNLKETMKPCCLTVRHSSFSIESSIFDVRLRHRSPRIVMRWPT